MIILIRFGFFVRCMVCVVLVTVMVALSTDRQVVDERPPSSRSQPTAAVVGQ